MEPSKKTRLAGGGIFAAGLLLLGGETLKWGWQKALDTISDGVSGGMSLAAFPWQNALAAMLTLSGGALLLWPAKKVRTVSKAERFQALQARGRLVAERIRHERNLRWFERERGLDLVDIARDGVSLLVDFEKQGLAVPDFANVKSAEKLLVGLELYLSTLGAFMRDGHVEQVEAMAQNVADRALAVSISFNPEDWYVNAYGR